MTKCDQRPKSEYENWCYAHDRSPSDCYEAQIKELQAELERLKRGLYEIKSTALSSDPSDFQNLPEKATALLAGEESSMAQRLIEEHVSAHKKTAKKLEVAELQVGVLTDLETWLDYEVSHSPLPLRRDSLRLVLEKLNDLKSRRTHDSRNQSLIPEGGFTVDDDTASVNPNIR